MSMHALLVSPLLAAALCGPAMAVSAALEGTDAFPTTARSADEFRIQADALRAELQPGGRYGNLSVEDRGAVAKDLATLQEMYEKHAHGVRVDKSLPMKISAINAYSRINARLGGDEDNRIICEQVRKVGSNRYAKYCATVRERRDNRLAAQKAHLEWFVPKPHNERAGGR